MSVDTLRPSVLATPASQAAPSFSFFSTSASPSYSTVPSPTPSYAPSHLSQAHSIAPHTDSQQSVQVTEDDAALVPFAMAYARREAEMTQTAEESTPQEDAMDLDWSEDSYRSTLSLVRTYMDLAHNLAMRGDIPSQGGPLAPKWPWRLERNTWLLVRSLLADRFASKQLLGQPPATPVRPASENPMAAREVVSALYASGDVDLRTIQIMTRWLESTHFEDAQYSVSDASWLTTMHTKRAKGHRRVAALDPDAPLRELGALALDDEENEQRFLRGLYELVRSGHLDQAQALCRECGQPWRAASLSGGSLFETNGEESRGNPRRALWKDACEALVRESRYAHERAVYGALIGALDAVLPVCASYDDHLWAHMHTALCLREDEALSQAGLEHRAPPTQLGNCAEIFEAAQRSFGAVDTQPKGRPQKSTTARMFHELHRRLVLGHVGPLSAWLVEQCKITEDGHYQCDIAFLRFALHLLAVLKQAGAPIPEGPLACFLRAYTRALSVKRQPALIALYTSRLPRELHVPTYGEFLMSIHEREERRACLAMAAEAEIDTVELAEWLIAQYEGPLEDTSDLVPVLSPKDEERVWALEWVCLDPSLRLSALLHANAAARAFTAARKLEAVRRIYDEVLPQGIVSDLRSAWGEQPPSLVERNAIKECLALRAHLHCHDLYAAWGDHRNARPAAPEVPVMAGSLSQDLMREQLNREHTLAVQHWEDQLRMATGTLVGALLELLQAEGGWLVDLERSEEDSADPPHHDHTDARTQQLELLRRLCLPALLFLLHRVCSETQMYLEFLRCATLVADASTALHAVLGKEELRQFLALAADCALHAMEPGELLP
eukprot:gnl/Trimastix_PCT/3256.p1 GENE.gnl/Trimastix_PCT/3256~~gnl/Trimastix_PCT/3256.p1  ORF type:complete len:840 (+),score=185.20 gnl/Trimastix_PCT/3256:3-2522(+)